MTNSFEALRGQFMERCRADLVQLRLLDPADAETAFIIHRLAGAAGSFGFPEISAVAADVDTRCREGAPPRQSDIDSLVRVVEDGVRKSGRAAPE